MKYINNIKINFRGGIISPGDLLNILIAAGKAGITHVRFGLRQQLLFDVLTEDYPALQEQLTLLKVDYEMNEDRHPNIVSSYPAEEVFITQSWLSEGVYKDIFDLVDYQPRLKINISDSNQSFTPLLTGNINWVASIQTPHFWHLFIRFPKTNIIYEWNEMVYTNDVARLSKHIETLIFHHHDLFYDNKQANGDALFNMVKQESYITKTAEAPAKLPAFNLPYYEGLNRYQDKYWLGIYRRDELFNIQFLKDICRLCQQTKIGQLCSTPWKSLIIKNIGEKDRWRWNNLLAKHQVNVRHAANELNFQVEDNCTEGLKMKNYLVKHLNNEDTRTFGVCIGVKTRRKSEVFSSILVRRRPLLRIAGAELFHVYDILCAHDFNPNERTGFVFSRNNPKFLLPEQLRRAISLYSSQRLNNIEAQEKTTPHKKENTPAKENKTWVHQCRHCFTIYDEAWGEPAQDIPKGTPFQSLPDHYTCSLCEAEKGEFVIIEKTGLHVQ
jgi:rubredoxin